MPNHKRKRYCFDVNGTSISRDPARDKACLDGLQQAFGEYCAFEWEEGKRKTSFRSWIESQKSKEEKQSAKSKYTIKTFIPFLQDKIAEINEKRMESKNSLSTHEARCLQQYTEFLLQFTQGIREVTGRDDITCFTNFDDKNPVHREMQQKLNQIYLSVINFLNEINEKNTGDSCIFRTFGTDGKMVKETLQQLYPCSVPFKAFPHNREVIEKNIKIDMYLPDHRNTEQVTACMDSGMQVWMDNHSRWKASGFSWTGGKPFYLDPQNKTVCIFFDDNASDKQILSVVIPGLEVAWLTTSAQHMDMQKKLQECLVELGWILPVKTWEAATNKNYFKNHMQRIWQQEQQDPDYALKCYAKIDTILKPYKEIIAKNKIGCTGWLRLHSDSPVVFQSTAVTADEVKTGVSCR